MTFTFNTSIPAASNDPSDDQPIMLSNNVATSGIIAVDHVGFNTSGGGQHLQVTFNSNNTPSLPASPPVLFTQINSGLPQLFFYSGDAAHSANQYNIIELNGSTVLFGGMVIKWGTSNFSGSSSNVTVTFTNPFPNTLFAVVAIPFGGNGAALNTVFQTSSNFQINRFYDSTSGLKFQWVAIGN